MICVQGSDTKSITVGCIKLLPFYLDGQERKVPYEEEDKLVYGHGGI